MDELNNLNQRINELEQERTSIILRITELKRKKESDFLNKKLSLKGQFFRTPNKLSYIFILNHDNFRNALQCIILEYDASTNMSDLCDTYITFQSFLEEGYIECSKEEFLENLNNHHSKILDLINEK